jgi:hypothetical protein
LLTFVKGAARQPILEQKQFARSHTTQQNGCRSRPRKFVYRQGAADFLGERKVNVFLVR